MIKNFRVLVPLDSQNEQTFGLALAYAEQIAKAAGVSSVILLTHTRGQLDGTGLSRFLGPVASKALTKGNTVDLSWGGKVRSETMKTLGYQARNSVVIAYYADESLLDFVDGLHGIAGAIAVPWVPGEADGWAARWSAHVHGQEKQPPRVLIDDPVVVRALETLTTIINLSTGLGHPRDKQMANEILRILRAKGHGDHSGTIKSWAIRHNWSPTAASDLEALAKKVWSLKTKPSLAGLHDPDGRYDRWKAGD
ncbi:hypothetical protein [Brucella anthropi]|uniref:hypothetical protein n=1 Tax=Brucella anthropi TaxID=529 RepID=UPI000774FA93|nr:hypothetical protein [Brucella anthropi]KXO73076.1 hypothetical protein AYJ56_18040 [Brucella anthropi]